MSDPQMRNLLLETSNGICLTLGTVKRFLFYKQLMINQLITSSGKIYNLYYMHYRDCFKSNCEVELCHY